MRGMSDRKQRLSIEVLPEEAPLIRQARATAALRGITLRELVLLALRKEITQPTVPDKSTG
jgi:hypothetical protein